MILKKDGPLSIEATFLESTVIWTSLAGSSRTMQGRRAFLLDVGFHRAGDAHVKVGGGEGQPTVLGHQQHVREDRQGGPGADHVLDLLETFQEDFFGNTELHGEKRRTRWLA
jgi:hypothetical protein